MPRWSALILSVALAVAAVPASAQRTSAPPPGFRPAQELFQSALSADQRILFQVMMTAAGYWNAVPNEDFSIRLFNAIKRFQSENGMEPTGQPDKAFLERMFAAADAKLNLWQFGAVRHPSRNVTIWVPFGFGMSSTRNEHGIRYADAGKRMIVDFTTVPNVSIGRNFDALMAELYSDRATMHYKVLKDGWFVASFTMPNGVDGYMRYHQDGSSVTGFTLHWLNENGNVNGERVAVLMSASLWSNMTGARFIDPPKLRPSRPAVDQEAVARPTPPPSPPKSKDDDETIKSGTGFFVDKSGAFVTNAHVVRGCSEAVVKTSDGLTKTARIAARDASNDLALLRVATTPAKIARLRVGVRLGENVAAFGFPHADILASSGNFTTGNVTALSGVADDSREFQVSAPVQSGNSGGPLLDQSGDLIGVVTSKLNAVKIAATSGDLPQNVNFAVKASILATFLESNGVPFEIGSSSDKPMSPPDVADQAKAISGFVLCK